MWISIDIDKLSTSYQHLSTSYQQSYPQKKMYNILILLVKKSYPQKNRLYINIIMN